MLVSRFIVSKLLRRVIPVSLAMIVPVAGGSVITAGFMGLSGCSIPGLSRLQSLTGKLSKGATVKEPPHVPILAPKADENADRFEQEIGSGFYADLENPSAQPWGMGRRSRMALREAVLQAIHFGILRPKGFTERFSPERQITYGEARKWIQSYQEILIEASHSPGKMSPVEVMPGGDGAGGNAAQLITTPSEEPSENGSTTSVAPVGKDSNASPMDVSKLRVPPADMAWEGHKLSESAPLTREELCALYAFLSRKEEAAYSLSNEAIEGMLPNGIDAGSDEVLAQFRDYTSIGEWARPFVAVAYHDQLPQDLFGLSSARLTVDAGFSPQRYVTRGEVIRLLYMVYGPSLAKVDPKEILARIHTRKARQSPNTTLDLERDSGSIPSPEQITYPKPAMEPMKRLKQPPRRPTPTSIENMESPETVSKPAQQTTTVQNKPAAKAAVGSSVGKPASGNGVRKEDTASRSGVTSPSQTVTKPNTAGSSSAKAKTPAKAEKSPATRPLRMDAPE